jgi:DNA repair exonuclease SbcCD nuclease subunit
VAEKWILTADTHANNRLPGNLEFSRQLIVDMGTLAREHGARHVIFAGDLLDQKHGLNLPVLLAVHSGLETIKAMGVRPIILPGNHDQPHPENPGFSPLVLLQKWATVLLSPRVVEGEDYSLVLIPWRPPEEYRKLVLEFTKAVFASRKRKILISHVSLAEGKVSPSQSIHQPIRAADLCPEAYQHVFLGDYHAAQALPGVEHVRYLGAPIPHTFGDYDNVGPWLFDTGSGALTPLRLPSDYPAFRKWAVSGEAGLPLPGYKPGNRNRILCPIEIMGLVKAAYPDAEIHPVEQEIKVEGSRIEKAETLTPQDIFSKWRSAQGLPVKPWQKMGEHYLLEAGRS